MVLNKILKTIINLFGGLLVTLGIVMIIFSMVFLSFGNNIDNLDEISIEAFDDFIIYNEDEIKDFMIEESRKEGILQDVNKNEILAGCDKGFFSNVFCSDAKLKSENELIKDFETYIVYDHFATFVGKNILDEIVKGMKHEWSRAMHFFNVFSYGIFAGIIVFLIGCFFIIISSMFKLYNALYRISFRTTVNFLTILIFIIIFNQLNSSRIAAWLTHSEKIMTMLPEFDIFARLSMSIIVELFKYSFNLVWFFVIGGLVVSIIATILLMSKRTDNIKKDKKKKKK